MQDATTRRRVEGRHEDMHATHAKATNERIERRERGVDEGVVNGRRDSRLCAIVCCVTCVGVTARRTLCVWAVCDHGPHEIVRQTAPERVPRGGEESG